MGTSTPQERKRHQIEKIQQLLQAQQQTKKRLDMYKSSFSSSTSNQKENDQLYTAQLCASVENRLQALCHPVHSLEELENLIDSKEEEDLLKCYNQEDFLSMSYEEKKKALDIHNRLLQCATKKKKLVANVSCRRRKIYSNVSLFFFFFFFTIQYTLTD
jgi:hypothetical protein